MAQLTYAEYLAILAAASWILGFAPVYLRRPGWTWLRAVGLALVVSPFVRMGLDFVDSVLAAITRYQTTGTIYQVLPAIPQAVWWDDVAQRVLWYAALPALGLLLVHRMWSRDSGEAAREIGAEHGLAPRASWRTDALHGLALFFAIALAYALAYGVDQLVPTTAAGADESRYWSQITVPLIVLLAGVSGLTEELLFRGILLSWLARRMPWLGAALLQAFLFALIHAGYGSWTHLLGPFLFGAGMAWVVRELGILPAALLHAQVNVLFFAVAVAPDYVATRGLGGALALAALVLAMAVASAWALWRTRARAVRRLWRSLRAGLRPVADDAAT
jgi:membrane protease YdiL (CAAX protease family)